MKVFTPQKFLSLAGLSALALIANTTVRYVVNDQGAYAFYMPPNHGLRVVQCQVSIRGYEVENFLAAQWLMCSTGNNNVIVANRDPSMPIQWDPSHVRMLLTNPN